jgi:acyl transferase domain-containing protein
MTDLTSEDSLDIAIVGMAGRFPQAADVAQFWRNLIDGRCAVRFFSDAELREAGVSPKLRDNPRYVAASGMLDDIDLFDADFFGYSPREAELMDPQHRVLLECAWEALERAGYDSERYPGLIGVYAGTGMNTYLLSNLDANPGLLETAGGRQLTLASSSDFLATRISYKLGLNGPSVNVQSACSTSLVAAVLACQGLHAYQCDMALAGGVAIDVMSRYGYLYQEDGALSPDGYCRAFDGAARGTVPASGAGLVVLKRVQDAVADGDRIHAVIKGSALNNDGGRRAGYTAPSIDGQTIVINTALANADVEPTSLGYVECHGTGTSLGDPIEIAALTAAFGEQRPDSRCLIGSVKTNIGHLDAAAGVAGLIKAALAVEAGVVPPSLYFNEANPAIDLENSPFAVARTLSTWPRRDGPRRAGVSSFGMGGTNAHLVLEEPPPAPVPSPEAEPQLLVLSARTEPALEAQTLNLALYLAAHPQADLADVAHTLQTGRRAFGYRRYLVCADPTEAVARLRDSPPRILAPGGGRPIALAFAGAGGRTSGAGAQLYRRDPVFRAEFDRCGQLYGPILARPLREVLADRAADPAEEDACHFATQYASARMWQTRGVPVEAVIGCGVGGVVAACVAGAINLADAVLLVVGGAEPAQLSAPGAAQYERAVAQVRWRRPRLPVVSPATGRWLTQREALDPGYWQDALFAAGRLEDGLKTLRAVPGMVVLDVGPGPLITTGPGYEPWAVAALPSAEGDDEQVHDLRAVGELWTRGGRIDLRTLHASPRRRVELPPYPFERRRFWFATPVPVDHPADEAPAQTLLHERPALQNPYVAPSSDIEQLIAGIWRDVLGLREVGLDDNFFELGGTSLLGIEILERLRQRVNAPIQMTLLYEGPTVRTLAKLVQRGGDRGEE